MKIWNSNAQVFNVEVQELLAKSFIRSFCQQIFTELLTLLQALWYFYMFLIKQKKWSFFLIELPF